MKKQNEDEKNELLLLSLNDLKIWYTQTSILVDYTYKISFSYNQW